jgi:hypothetical protein
LNLFGGVSPQEYEFDVASPAHMPSSDACDPAYWTGVCTVIGVVMAEFV